MGLMLHGVHKPAYPARTRRLLIPSSTLNVFGKYSRPSEPCTERTRGVSRQDRAGRLLREYAPCAAQNMRHAFPSLEGAKNSFPPFMRPAETNSSSGNDQGKVHQILNL